MSWTPDTVLQHFDKLLVEQRVASERLHDANEKRFNAFSSQLEAIRAGWHDRFVSHEKAVDARLGALTKSIDELRRLVYIGLGIAIAAQIIIPLLHK